MITPNEINLYAPVWKDIQDKLSDSCMHRKKVWRHTYQTVNQLIVGFLWKSMTSMGFFPSSYQTYFGILTTTQVPSSVILLGRLTRFDNKLYSWLKFVIIKSTEQKQQEEDMHQGVQEVWYKESPGRSGTRGVQGCTGCAFSLAADDRDMCRVSAQGNHSSVRV